jgi:hypothetical protein
LSIDMAPEPTDDYRLQIGRRAQEIVFEVLRDPRPAGSVLPLTQAAARVLADHPIPYRPRDSLLQAVTAAGVYLRRFRLHPEWALLGTELAVEDCRFDLVWEHPRHGVLIDELKLGVGRRGELAVRAQINRYLDAGSNRWADFIGVRLCAVHEPAASRLYLPDSVQSGLVSASPLASEFSPR